MIIFRLSLLAGLLLLSSCLSPYKIDIQQGNYVSGETMAQLKREMARGLTKEQVRFILGTPLIVDVFHVERWDYVFTMQKKGGPIERHKFSIFFEEGKLKRVESDVANLPTS